ncbi:oligosaccharide flippase family protein [Flavobacterium sp.]|uniref:lipopolysaccharide biosynthesis protein n=1 Tax=Flavobacterium sp. TaxID=239 RepID=UPI0025BD9F28|nr:oligosaccharide flippase family protein [Flavobacterium sp.]
MTYFLQLLGVQIDKLAKQERSKKLLINVLGSFFVKAISMAITLTLIPVSLKYTEASTYGVWLTLSSVIVWFNLFDFGLSSGLTNKLTESFAKNDIQSARIYLSTTYYFLAVIILPLSLIFFVASNFIDWNVVFNTTINKAELRTAIYLMYVSFCFSFLLKPINHVLKSKQKHFVLSSIQVAGNLIALICIVLMGDMFSSKFIFLCCVLSFTYPIVLLIATLVLYLGIFKDIQPKMVFASKKHFKNVFGVSAKFFIIEISVIAILMSNNILIAHLVDNQNVTYYNIAYRLFSIITIFQYMIMIPLWPAYTDAYTLKDYNWIRSAVSKSNKLNFALCIPLVLMFLLSDQIYFYWIGDDIKIPFEVNLLLMIFVGIGTFKESYVSFINGVGRVNLQAVYSAVTIVLQVPLAYFLAKHLKLGLTGILLLNIFWVVIGFILWRIQYAVIMNSNSTKKIWQ